MKKYLGLLALLLLSFSSFAETLNFDQPFATESWTEDGLNWAWDGSGWDNIREYVPYAGTGHGMSAPGFHSKLSTSSLINIQGIWLYTSSGFDLSHLNLKGYDTAGALIYDVSLDPYDYEFGYAYVTLNWTNVKSFMVDFDEIPGGFADLFYDEMEYTVAVLPVELQYFSTHCDKDKVNIGWETASESNNDYFNIERSADGKNFNSIATIAGAGNSTHSIRYTYTDLKPLAGDSYYRLKQTDYNGEFEYSDIVISICNAGSMGIDIFPNPFSLQTSLHADKALSNATLIIYNSTGQAVKQFNNISGQDITIYREELTHGLYYIQLAIENKIISTKKLIVID